MQTKGVVILALGGLTFILLAASCGGVEWLNFEVTGLKTQRGLWRFCTETILISGCDSIPCKSHLYESAKNVFAMW